MASAAKTPCVAHATTPVAPCARHAARRAGDRVARADEVVDDHRHPAGDVAHQHAAAQRAFAAVLLDERDLDGAPESRGEPQPQRIGALDRAGVGRDHRHRRLPEPRDQVRDEQRRGREVLAAAAVGVLVGCDVVHVDRHHARRARRLEEGGDVARGHGIARLRALVLARIREVRRDDRDPRGRRVLQRRDEEQQAHEHRVDVVLRGAGDGLDHVHVGAAHALERARLVLAVLEHALLVRGEPRAQRRRHGAGIVPSAVEREDAQIVGHAATVPGRRFARVLR